MTTPTTIPAGVDGPESCRTCGLEIDFDDEHYPHPPDCARNQAGWCTCHHPTHPDCCPECNPGVPW